MLFGFATDNRIKALSAFLIYAIYQSKDPKSGTYYWADIEKYIKKEALNASGDVCRFIEKFKFQVGCVNINVKLCITGELEGHNNLLIYITELGEKEQREIMSCLLNSTQSVIMLARERQWREKTDVKIDDIEQIYEELEEDALEV